MKYKFKSILSTRPVYWESRPFLKRILREDGVFAGDWTSFLLPDPGKDMTARIIVRESALIAGLPLACELFALSDRRIRILSCIKEGSKVCSGQTVLKIRGKASGILKAERSVLNLLQRQSGIATTTNRMIKLMGRTKTKLLDTRKTIPGMRFPDKYAVRAGGGVNHRLNLNDGILIKENHISSAGSLTAAVERALKKKPKHLKIEVEVQDIRELQEALELSVDQILLDNFSPSLIKKAVCLNQGRKIIEISGGINEKNIRSYSGLGADYISTGSITHSVRAVDLSLLAES